MKIRKKKKPTAFYRFLKRSLDIFFSFLAIIVLIPFLILVAIIIKIESKGPAIFRQKRIGRNGKIFKILKFRSMRVETPSEVATNLLDKPQEYITHFGRFIRNTSIDELPQLLNIIKGDMSIIGPRPVILTETLLIEQRMKNGVSELRPGLSGWAQINGRNNIGVNSKAELDKFYADNISFCFDTKIFFLTIRKVFEMKDVTEGNGTI